MVHVPLVNIKITEEIDKKEKKKEKEKVKKNLGGDANRPVEYHPIIIHAVADVSQQGDLEVSLPCYKSPVIIHPLKSNKRIVIIHTHTHTHTVTNKGGAYGIPKMLLNLYP